MKTTENKTKKEIMHIQMSTMKQVLDIIFQLKALQ